MYKLFAGDNAEILSTFGSGTIPLTMTSPPYDKNREYEGYEYDLDAVAKQLYRVTKDGGVVVWIIADATIKGSETGSSFKQALHMMSVGFNLHDTEIYAKNNPMPNDCGKRYRQCWEYMFIFSKGTPETFNPITVPVKGKSEVFKSFRVTSVGRGDLNEDRLAPAERKVSNIFYYTIGSASSSDSFAKLHPAIFPEKMALDHILSWSNPNDIVLDPFCGSGSSLLAATQMGGTAIGIDISERYCEIAARRCAQEVMDLR